MCCAACQRVLRTPRQAERVGGQTEPYIMFMSGGDWVGIFLFRYLIFIGLNFSKKVSYFSCIIHMIMPMFYYFSF